jgi:signal transduction histidine kinase
VLTAARLLRDGAGLTRWQAEQRARGAERRRTAVAALERVVATTEEFHRLYTTADRDRASTAQDASNLDSLARETLRESEDARTQIAHNLHDTAAQSMVSAHRFLEAARASLAGPDSAAAGRAAADRHLDAAGERLLIAIREVRGVLNSLVPPGLEELGLANALRIYIRDAVPGTILVEIAGDLPRAEGWLEAGLFAMTIGAIDNAVIHARPTLVEIALRADGRTGIISVRDDGVGFDPGQARRRTGTGMGLLQMARRASWLGGRLDVTSRPGEGTTVRMTVPLGEPPGAGGAGR